VRRLLLFITLCILDAFSTKAATTQAAAPADNPPKVLLLFSLNVESDHALFAVDAIKFFTELADKDGYQVDATTNWEELDDVHLKKYKLVVWLDGSPTIEAQRQAFQRYMTSSGSWLGFHVSGYNDKHTNWPWFMTFIGGGLFEANSWPPVPAELIVDDPNSPVTKNLPKHFLSPTNEWYRWKPSPRLDRNIHVLLTLDPANYPLGIKGLLTSGDIPVVWTNINYKMIYMNMGHGDKVFNSPVQNKLFENSILWLLGKSPDHE
jgi:type 1 glutamine amidotransferase